MVVINMLGGKKDNFKCQDKSTEYRTRLFQKDHAPLSTVCPLCRIKRIIGNAFSINMALVNNLLSIKISKIAYFLWLTDIFQVNHITYLISTIIRAIVKFVHI